MYTQSQCSKTILLLDHDTAYLDKVAEAIREAGYQCTRASCYDSAVEQIRRSPPHMIVAELNLAGRNAVTLCQQLQVHEELFKVPLMFLSAKQSVDVMRRSEAGGSYFLRKPLNFKVLIQLISTSLASVAAAAEPTPAPNPADLPLAINNEEAFHPQASELQALPTANEVHEIADPLETLDLQSDDSAPGLRRSGRRLFVASV